MVKGLAAVDWKKPENNGKLFAAVLAQFPGTPDYKKIAAIFGEFIWLSRVSSTENISLYLLDSNLSVPRILEKAKSSLSR